MKNFPESTWLQEFRILYRVRLPLATRQIIMYQHLQVWIGGQRDLSPLYVTKSLLVWIKSKILHFCCDRLKTRKAVAHPGPSVPQVLWKDSYTRPRGSSPAWVSSNFSTVLWSMVTQAVVEDWQPLLTHTLGVVVEYAQSPHTHILDMYVRSHYA